MRTSILLNLIITIMLFSTAKIASAQDVYVNGYTRNDGTYVQPHHRTSPDNSTYNNYSSDGNSNPYTGNIGSRSPSYNDNSSSGYDMGTTPNSSLYGNRPTTTDSVIGKQLPNNYGR
jgi:hypothetical protein